MAADAKMIIDSKIIGIVRGASADEVIEIIDALERGGVSTVEITADTAQITELLSEVSLSFGDEITLGAGTVLDAETARSVLLSGAEFIVTPTVDLDVIQMANRYGAPSFPGAFTPTEVLTAYEHGADAVKLFPASTGGPAHVRSVLGPLSQVPLVPTGGVTLDSAGDYFEAGAAAVGVGGSLVDREAIESGAFGIIEDNAVAFSGVADQY